MAAGSEAKKARRQDLNSVEEREVPAKVWKYCELVGEGEGGVCGIGGGLTCGMNLSKRDLVRSFSRW